MKRPPKFPLEYEKAIRGPRGITRKRTTKEAEKAFDALCQDLYAAKIRQYYIAKFGRADEKRVQGRVEEIKQHYREEGFDQVSFEQCRNHYNQMPRRRPRKKRKKLFDVAEVTKTPLEPDPSALMAFAKYLMKQEK